MSRKLSIIIALGAVVVAIAAYIIVRNLPEAPFEPPARRERWTHLDVRSSDLAYIEFNRGGDDRLVFERVAREVDGETREEWMVTYPELTFTPKSTAYNDFTFTMSNIYSENLVEEEPEDLSIYGLGDPNGKLIVKTKTDEDVEISIGSLTPTGVSYYMQLAGDPAVYTLRKYTVDKVYMDVDTLRDSTIAVPDPQALAYLKIVSDRTIEVVPITQEERSLALATTGAFKLIQPYRTPRIIDSQRFDETMQQVPASFSAVDFVDDNPSDLSQYGLQNPRYEFEMRDQSGQSLHLLFGEEADDDHAYAKRAEQPSVFTLRKSALPFLQADPFTLAEKFMLIVSILYVDEIILEGPGARHVVRIDYSNYDAESDEGAVYYLDDVVIEEDLFKKYYQVVIGLIADAENPNPGPLQTTPDVSIEFSLNDGVPVETARLDLVQINKDFYSAYRDGYSEFLVSDYQVEAMFDEAVRLLEVAADTEE